MGTSIDMNIGVFWQTSVSFLNSVGLQLSPKYSQSYANLNVKSRPTALKSGPGFFNVFYLNLTSRTL